MARKTQWELEQFRSLLAEFNHACAGCGSPLDLERDHVTPRSAGGSDRRENLQILCHHCNNAKNGTRGLPRLMPMQPVDSCAEIAANRANFLQWLAQAKTL